MSEQPSSKDLVSWVRRWCDCARVSHEETGRILQLCEEVERLRTALTGIQSCSTCEACRGAATLALGGVQPKPAHEREMPHCSTCTCPPYQPKANPFDKARAVFAGKKGDGYLLKLWFDTQEDLDSAFDAVEGISEPTKSGRDADQTSRGSAAPTPRGSLSNSLGASNEPAADDRNEIERLHLALRRIRGHVEMPSTDQQRAIYNLAEAALLPTLADGAAQPPGAG